MSDRLPDPFVPADADLRGLSFMPLDVGRLLDSDLFALSSGEEFKAAVALWAKSWTQVPAGSLPDDERVLAHLSGTGARWKKLRSMALRGFIKCSDGRLYHPVISEKVREAWAMRLRQRERAIRGNAKRWGGAASSPKDEQDASSGDRHGDRGWDRKGQGQGQGQGQLRIDPSHGLSLSRIGNSAGLSATPDDGEISFGVLR